MVATSETKVIGFFAYRTPLEVVCSDVDACVIAGSEEAIREYLDEVYPGGADRMTVKKTRFGEIVRGMEVGGAYAFDELAYSRFLPLARAWGMLVAEADFATARSAGNRFFTVRPLRH